MAVLLCQLFALAGFCGLGGDTLTASVQLVSRRGSVGGRQQHEERRGVGRQRWGEQWKWASAHEEASCLEGGLGPS